MLISSIDLPRASHAGIWAQRDPYPTASRPVAGLEQAARTAAYGRIREWRGGGSLERDLRVAFVGQRLYFGPSSLPSRLPGLTSTFVDFVHGGNPGPAIAQIQRFDPDVVIGIRPEIVHPVLADCRDRPVIGFFSEPLPYPGRLGNPDLGRRWRDLALLPKQSCDIYIGYNGTYREALESVVPIWTYMPLPVCDDVYGSPETVAVPDPFTGLFIGRVTKRRERILGPLKHSYNWTVVDHGMIPALESFSVALNLHNEEYANFENRVPMHLARGHLVLSEQLTPAYELQDGVNICVFEDSYQLEAYAEQLLAEPWTFHRVAQRGRMAAEAFRASRLWNDRLIDLSLLL